MDQKSSKPAIVLASKKSSKQKKNCVIIRQPIFKKILVLFSASTTQSRIRKRTVPQQSDPDVKKSRLAPNAGPTLAQVTSTPSSPIETEPVEANEVVNNKGKKIN